LQITVEETGSGGSKTSKLGVLAGNFREKSKKFEKNCKIFKKTLAKIAPALIIKSVIRGLFFLCLGFGEAVTL